ncbi:hypothetical protein ZWY2020_046176 [Hordeum vulgare]|nr:hypothetical protein ZWY2020_046176 [Hordeum vulgare]
MATFVLAEPAGRPWPRPCSSKKEEAEASTHGPRSDGVVDRRAQQHNISTTQALVGAPVLAGDEEERRGSRLLGKRRGSGSQGREGEHGRRDLATGAVGTRRDGSLSRSGGTAAECRKLCSSLILNLYVERGRDGRRKK